MHCAAVGLQSTCRQRLFRLDASYSRASLLLPSFETPSCKLGWQKITAQGHKEKRASIGKNA